jgi:hypothetical protein
MPRRNVSMVDARSTTTALSRRRRKGLFCVSNP